MPTTPPVTLSEDDRSQLWTTVHRGKTNARTLKRAQVLLKVADGWTAGEIADAFDVSLSTVANVCGRFRDGGVEALTGEQQAHLIAIACSSVPEGHDHWTLRLLAGQAVELGFVARVSPETIRALLRRTTSSRGSTGSGASRR